jgi:hypothetical protein
MVVKKVENTVSRSSKVAGSWKAAKDFCGNDKNKVVMKAKFKSVPFIF